MMVNGRNEEENSSYRLGSVGTWFVGTILSFYSSLYQDFVVYRTSYGFPFGWHGHELAVEPAHILDPGGVSQ